MANQTPFFMSGPRLLIKIDGVKVAYAVGLDLRVSRNVQVVNTLGSYASVALQATMYNGVTGSMQIVRLMDKKSRQKYGQAKLADNATAEDKAAADNDTLAKATPADALTGIPNSSTTLNNSVSDTNTVIAATENLKKHLDPASVLASATFDIEVWQMYPKVGATESDAGRLNNQGVLVKHFTVQNCRLNSRSASISAGQLLTESFSFTGTLLVSDDRAGTGVADEVESSDPSAFGSGV